MEPFWALGPHLTDLNCFAGYSKTDNQNIADHEEDVPHPSLGNQLAGNEARRPVAARVPSWVSKKAPIKSGVLDIEKLQNARPVVLPGDPDQPLVFPLKGSNANTMPLPQGSESGLGSDWTMTPAVSGSRVSGLDASSNVRPLIYEEVFTFPAKVAPQYKSQPSPAAGGSVQVGQGSPSGSDSLPQEQPVSVPVRPSRPSRRTASYHPEYRQAVGTAGWKRMPEKPMRAPVRRKQRYPPMIINQYSNGHMNFRSVYRNTKYTPEYEEEEEVAPALPAGSFGGPPRYS